MTDPDRTPRTPDLPPPDGARAPDIAEVAAEEGRDPTEGPASDQNRSAARTAKAEGEGDGEEEPPD
ncbi:hypothetical protein ACFV1L_05120 [Kitasatospora sp. NPDC059646]|uniref:hypothetical protein n=1 Tax=Kitasatospora sp. NPDC059646 TaxID=3346893 RepID=UPI00369CC4B2